MCVVGDNGNCADAKYTHYGPMQTPVAFISSPNASNTLELIINDNRVHCETSLWSLVNHVRPFGE